MVKVKFWIGKSELTCEADNMKDIHKFSSVWGSMPQKCDNCGKENIYLSHKAPGGNDYYTLKCKDCGAELTLHQKKEGGFYVKWSDKMEVYQSDKSGQQSTNDGQKSTNPGSDISNPEIDALGNEPAF